MLYIEMHRGDLKKFKFPIKLKKSNTILKVDLDEIYISFKITTEDKDYLFQKKLSDGSIFRDDNFYYHFAILPEDKDNLRYGYYKFDIEVIKYDSKGNVSIKQTVCGELNLLEEATFKSNEV